MSSDRAAVCKQHLDFMVWADDRMLGAIAKDMPENISVLQHIYLGEMVWIKRVQGDGNVAIQELSPPASVIDLQKLWPALHREWQKIGANDDCNRIVEYRRQNVDIASPLWQIVLHLVNHGSYHRGQVAASLRAGGFPPPPTDLMVYYRTLG
ncbi:MAG TPA: DinB family protein [Bryobacteraceae bacterium]|nr:DinB family protein [Bryobacteraceae bacterium]